MQALQQLLVVENFEAERIDLPAPGEEIFSEFELSAIAIGQKDGRSSVANFGVWYRLIRLLFGIRPPIPLTDTKLEAIRQLVVNLRFSPANGIMAILRDVDIQNVPVHKAQAIAALVARARDTSHTHV